MQADFRQARQRAESLGLIFLDLDHFKDLNDVHGHQAGDHVLRRVGQRLSDLAKDVGFAARYGGEEFVVIIAGKTAESVRAIAETIRKGIEANPVEFDTGRLNITASLGVAFVDVPAVDLTIEQFIEQADQQLYRAKRQGRNRVSIEAVWACSL